MSSNEYKSAVVIGSGPAGLCSAIMLVQRGFSSIKVFDRLPEPPLPNSTLWEDLNSDRAYNIGINGRGQAALRRFGVMSKIDSYATTVVGRRDWTPESPVDEPRELIFGEQKSYLTKCIQRDRLTSCLIEVVRDTYSDKIQLFFQTECSNVQWTQNEQDKEICILTLKSNYENENEKTWKEETEFVIGADGAQSAIRSSMELIKENGFRHIKYEDKNVRVYRTIPLHFPKDSTTWRKDINYSARTKSDVNLDALPTREGPYVGVVLFRPWDKRLIDMDGQAAKDFFHSVFPMFAPFIEEKDFEVFSKKKPSSLPKFSFAGPVLHKGQTACLLGDSIHTVKPYFGMGVNSAFEDILILDNALERNGNNVGKAIESFSSVRAKDVKALVHMSRKLDGGFLSFVLPLIVDTVLNNVAPWIFSPNSISSLQNEKKSFTQIQARKRLDRVMQISLGLTFLLGLLKSLKFMSGLLFNIFGKYVPFPR